MCFELKKNYFCSKLVPVKRIWLVSEIFFGDKLLQKYPLFIHFETL